MKVKYFLLTISLCIIKFVCFAQLGTTHFLYPGTDEINKLYHAPYIETPPTINGIPDDPVWELAEWGKAQVY